MMEAGAVCRIAALTAVFAGAVVPVRAGGPTWKEGVDAGSIPPDAEVTSGAGALRRIEGEIEGTALAGGDFEDMFVIRVCDPAEFLASTAMLPPPPMPAGGPTLFNTELWLFDGPGMATVGRGRLGNDDLSKVSDLSLLTPDTDDGTPGLVTPGPYFIAISGFQNEPLSGPMGQQELIFLLLTPTEVSGPDGPGGPSPITAWSGDGASETGAYTIFLRGVTFFDVPMEDCNDNGVVDSCDITTGRSLDCNQNGVPDECECLEDLDMNGEVGFSDLLTLLANWGPCGPPPPCLGDLNCNDIIGFGDLLAMLSAWGPCS